MPKTIIKTLTEKTLSTELKTLLKEVKKLVVGPVEDFSAHLEKIKARQMLLYQQYSIDMQSELRDELNRAIALLIQLKQQIDSIKLPYGPDWRRRSNSAHHRLDALSAQLTYFVGINSIKAAPISGLFKTIIDKKAQIRDNFKHIKDKERIKTMQEFDTVAEQEIVAARQAVITNQIRAARQEAAIRHQAQLAAAQAAPVVAQAAPVVAQAAPIVAQAAPVVAQAAPVVAQAAPVVVARAEPVVAQAPPVVPAAAQNNDEPLQLKTGEASLLQDVQSFTNFALFTTKKIKISAIDRRNGGREPQAELGQNNGQVLYKGYLLKASECLVVTAQLAPTAAAPQEAVFIRLEQYSTGRVLDYSSKNANLSEEQKQLIALKQAKMMLDNYDPKKGKIVIKGKDLQQVGRVYAAVLYFAMNNPEISKKMSFGPMMDASAFIHCAVIGFDAPGRLTNKGAFIKKHLPNIERFTSQNLLTQIDKKDMKERILALRNVVGDGFFENKAQDFVKKEQSELSVNGSRYKEAPLAAEADDIAENPQAAAPRAP